MEDKVMDSLPEANKFTIRGRNFTARRVPLGQRIELARFFMRLLGPLGELGIDPKGFSMDKLLSRLPDLLAELGKEYQDVITSCTNIPGDYLEQECEIEDIYVILRKVADVNNFGKTAKSFGELGSKKNILPIGSSDGSGTSA